MKSIVTYITEHKRNTKQLGKITFQLDEASMEFLSDEFKEMILEGYVFEMSKYPEKYKHNKQRGNRTVWTSSDGDKLLMGDHATQREDRPIENGGDGEHIDEQEIIDMFIYTWSDIMEMYYDGYLKLSNNVRSFTIQSKCYLTGSEKNLVPDGARPEDQHLWAAWLIEDDYHDKNKVNITIKTLFRGEFFKHGRAQERILIANNGYVKQIKPRY